MKIILIQTPWSGSSAGSFKRVAKKYASYPPIGLMYLAAYLEQHGHRANILDLEVNPLYVDELCAVIRKNGADIIGITTSTPVFHIARALAKALKEKLGLPIVVGGPHITVLKDKTFSEEFDFGVANEGEYTLRELMDEMEGNKNYSKIAGLIYRDGAEVKVNQPRPFIQDLDSLPFPARDKIDPHQYAFEVPGKGFLPVMTTELTRGCPFSCVFCSEPMNTGRKLRSRSAKNVVDEIVDVQAKFGIHHVFMLDSTLTANRKLIEAFCHELIDRNVNITFEGQTRANLIDEQLITLMKKAGLNRLNFGLESSDKKVLALMKKNIDPESIRSAFRLCKRFHISALCGSMMGNPGDTRDTILATARFVRSIPEIRYSPVAIAVPYPGTELHLMAQNHMHGLKLIESDYSYYSRYAGGVMEVDGMKPSDLVKLQRRALIISHATPRKIIGLIQHFGFFVLVGMILQMAKSEIMILAGKRDPNLNSIEHENTTLKNMGINTGSFRK